MYKCEICSKEYSSNKRYLCHIENCENKRSSVSGLTDDMLDLDDELPTSVKSSDKYSARSINTVESLTKDKAKYKNVLKKYQIKELEMKKQEKTNKDYFDKKLSNLVLERDELIDKVNELNEDNLILQAEFTSKCSDEKKRYGVNKTSITNLQATIEKLQSQVNIQLEEKEKIRLDSDEVIEKNKTEINQLKNINNRLCQTLESERADFRKNQDSSILLFRREKEQALLVLETEKDTLIQSLQFSIKNLHKDKEQEAKKHSQQITDEKYKYDLSIQEFDILNKRIKDSHIKAIEQLKNNHDSFINNVKNQHTITLTSLTEKHSKEKIMIESINFDTNKKFRCDFFTREQELLSEIAKLNKNVTSIQEESYKQKEVFIKDAEIYMSITEKKKNEDIDSIKLNMNKMHKTEIDERDNIINEIQRLNHSLGAQVGQYNSTIDNIKNDTDRLKLQFIFNLNKQKEEYDNIITELEDKLKNSKNREEKIKTQLTTEFNNNSIELLAHYEKNINSFIFEKDQLVLSLETEKKNSETKLQEVTDSLKKQFVSTFNKQKQEYDKLIKELEDNLKKLKTTEDNMKIMMTTELNNQRRELLDHNEKSHASFIIEKEQAKLEKEQLVSSLDKIKNNVTTELNNQRRELLEHNEKNIASFIVEKEQLVSSLETAKLNYATKLEEVTERLKKQFVISLNKQKEEYDKVINELEDKLKKFKDREDNMKMLMITELNNQRRELLNHNEKSLTECIAERAQIKLDKIKIDSSLETARIEYLNELQKVLDSFVIKEAELNKQIEQLMMHINRSEYIIKSNQQDFSTQLIEQVSKYKDVEKILESIITERNQLKIDKDKLISTIETNRLDHEEQLQKNTDSFTSKEIDLNKQIEQLLIHINHSEYIIKTNQIDFATQLVEQVSKYKDDLYKLNNFT